MSPGDDFKRLIKWQDCQTRDQEKTGIKNVFSKNISGPTREKATLTKHHWKHKLWTTNHGNVTFPAVIKSISSKEAHFGLGRSWAHKKATKSHSNGTWKKGVFMKWDLPERELTRTALWINAQFKISCLLRSVYDTLWSPANWQQWGLSEDLNCKLCGKRETMAHIVYSIKMPSSNGSKEI